MNERLKSNLLKIEEDLLNYVSNKLYKGNFGLYCGLGGIILFYFYFARYTKSREKKKLAYELLEECIVLAANNPQKFTYCDGLAGIGWLIEHLVQEKFITKDYLNILDGLDNDMEEIMFNELNKGNYDFLHGAMGCYYYFLSRSKKKFVNRITNNLVEFLNSSKISFDSKNYGWVAYDNQYNIKKNEYDFGIAHGIPSISILLSKAVMLGYDHQNTIKLLNETLAFINYYRQSNCLSLFPYNSKTINQNSRLAWCYGDISVILAFYQAGLATKNDNLITEALSMLYYNLERQDPKKNQVIDSCFCHGSAGIAHIYNYFNAMSPNINTVDASLFWLETTLSFSKYEDSKSGYKFLIPKCGFNPNFSLLEGLAGVGLSFMSYLSPSDERPKWDKCFLIS